MARERRFLQTPDRLFKLHSDPNVAGVFFGGGGFLTPAVSAGAEIDSGRDVTSETGVTVPINGRAVNVVTQYVSKRRTVSGLFGIHSPKDKIIRVGAYAGLALSSFEQRIGTAASNASTGAPPPTVFTHYGAAPIVGADVAAVFERVA